MASLYVFFFSLRVVFGISENEILNFWDAIMLLRDLSVLSWNNLLFFVWIWFGYCIGGLENVD